MTSYTEVGRLGAKLTGKGVLFHWAPTANEEWTTTHERAKTVFSMSNSGA
jgi:hypothetical protein